MSEDRGGPFNPDTGRPREFILPGTDQPLQDKGVQTYTNVQLPIEQTDPSGATIYNSPGDPYYPQGYPNPPQLYAAPGGGPSRIVHGFAMHRESEGAYRPLGPQEYGLSQDEYQRVIGNRANEFFNQLNYFSAGRMPAGGYTVPPEAIDRYAAQHPLPIHNQWPQQTPEPPSFNLKMRPHGLGVPPPEGAPGSPTGPKHIPGDISQLAATVPQQQAQATGPAAEIPYGPVQGQLHLLPQFQGLGNTRPFGPGEAIRMPNGSITSEETYTVQMGNRWSVIPGLWLINGTPTHLTEDQARNMAVRSGLQWPFTYDSREQADAYAKQREAIWNQTPQTLGMTVAQSALWRAQ